MGGLKFKVPRFKVGICQPFLWHLYRYAQIHVEILRLQKVSYLEGAIM